MRSVKSLGVLLACLLPTAAGAEYVPPAPAGEFALTVCNSAGTPFWFTFVTHVSPADDHFQVVGWFQANAGCQRLGFYPQGNFYYFGYGFPNNRLSTVGGTVMKCVNPTNIFTRPDSGDVQCPPLAQPFTNSMLVGFATLSIPPTTNEYVVTVGPGS